MEHWGEVADRCWNGHPVNSLGIVARKPGLDDRSERETPSMKEVGIVSWCSLPKSRRRCFVF